MKNVLKQNKGIAATDALIAILIISLFTGLIATILYNIYLSNTALKRMTNANNYIIDILEYTDKLYYDDLTTTTKLKQKYSYLTDVQNPVTPEEEDLDRLWKLEGTIDNGYNVEIVLDKYMPDQDALDLVRRVTVTIDYKVGNRTQGIKISKIKSRENLEIPNKPDLSLLQVQANEKVYEIKIKDENYVICEQNDKEWYNYDIEKPTQSISAKVIITSDELSIEDVISDEDYTLYQWVPRYIEDENEKVIFLYSNTNCTVEKNQQGYNTLVEQNINPIQEFQNNTGFWQEMSN